MSYRDDLDAAHARIAALEAQLANTTDAVSVARGDVEEAWHAERTRMLDELTDLRTTLNTAMSELTGLRDERVRMLERIRVLQTRSGTAPAPAPKIVPQPAAGKWPALWDHNRRFGAVSGGKVANVVCPTCRAAGEEVQMVRELGAGSAVAQESAYQLEEVTCPRCMFTGWLRER